MTRPLSPSDLATYPTRCAACPTIFDASANTIRRHRRIGTAPLCPECIELKRAAIGARARGATGRVEKAKRAICWMCSDLPWRRPKHELCRCGKPYEPEQFDARSYVAELPRPDARVLPNGGPR